MFLLIIQSGFFPFIQFSLRKKKPIQGTGTYIFVINNVTYTVTLQFLSFLYFL